MTARTSISLPDDLKRRMDAVATSVNWSRVAVVAFEAKLAELAQRKRNKGMQEVIQRLRASRVSEEDQEQRDGYEAGCKWAREYAEWSELVALEKDYGRTYECLPDVYVAINRDPQIHYTDPEDLETEFGSSEPSPSYLAAFVEGAMAVYQEVRDGVIDA